MGTTQWRPLPSFGIISKMLDVDIFPWLGEKRRPTEEERYRSSTIVADRLLSRMACADCGTAVGSYSV
jgi:hypothetical protein